MRKIVIKDMNIYHPIPEANYRFNIEFIEFNDETLFANENHGKLNLNLQLPSNTMMYQSTTQYLTEIIKALACKIERDYIASLPENEL